MICEQIAVRTKVHQDSVYCVRNITGNKKNYFAKGRKGTFGNGKSCIFAASFSDEGPIAQSVRAADS